MMESHAFDGLDDLDSAEVSDTEPNYFDRAAEFASRPRRHRPYGGTGGSQMNCHGDPIAQISTADKRALFAADNPEVVEWIDANPKFEFAVSLSEALAKYGSLTEGQVAGVHKCMARDADRATQRTAAQVSVAGAGFAALLAAFTKAAASGLKHPALTFQNVTFKLAKASSKNPGSLYVTGGKRFGSEYFGKISPQGVFSPAFACPPSVREEVKRIGADPLGESVAHGKRTGNCCACNRPLTDAESVTRGIGPVCAERFFGG
jgi:uncharacterized protein DUF6011